MDEPKAPRALLLDLDGTIADTLPHIFDTYRHAVAPWVQRLPTDAEIEATFGPPDRVCIALMAPNAHLDEAVERFHTYHEANHDRAVSLVEGMLDVIDHARALGWKVGIFTGKGRRAAEFSLSALGVMDRVDHLVSGTDVVRPKPDPEGVFQAAETLGVPLGRILLVGDSPADVQAGRSAGSMTAAVLWAAFQPSRLREAGADFVCDRVADLQDVVDHLDRQP